MPTDFHNVRAWELADDFAVVVYGATVEFPKHECLWFTQQPGPGCIQHSRGLRRRPTSSTCGPRHCPRLAEARYQLHLSHRLGYLTVRSNALDEQVSSRPHAHA